MSGSDQNDDRYVEDSVKRGAWLPPGHPFREEEDSASKRPTKPPFGSSEERISELESQLEEYKHQAAHWQARHIEATDAIAQTKKDAEEQVERIKRDAELKVAAKVAELELQDYERSKVDKEQIEFYQEFFDKTLRRKISRFGHRIFDAVDAPR